ncbi:MAG: hypothetical protein IEMM0002_0586 [bacterium]|nr:MAG: hypothetical protein IEMM0002_0586 [bacterium]
MSNAAKSIFAWGVYLALMGFALLLIPDFILSLFAFPAPGEIWIRVLGVVVTALGYYHIQAARNGFIEFFKWSVQGRAFTVACFSAFVVSGLTKPQLLLFAAADFFSALWTGLTLRASRNSG